MTRNEGDLLDRKSRFEELLVPSCLKIVKVKVFDFKSAALASEGRTHRTSVVWENSGAAIAGKRTLLLDDRDGIVASYIK